jgi:hypothetical protein
MNRENKLSLALPPWRVKWLLREGKPSLALPLSRA